MKLTFSLLLLIPLQACALEENQGIPNAEAATDRAEPLGPKVAIFPAQLGVQVRYLGYDKAAGYWTPEVSDIGIIEQGLRHELERALEDPEAVVPYAAGKPDRQAWLRGELTLILAELDSYHRQYVGILDSRGRKQVLVRCFLSSRDGGAFDFPRWREELAIVSDGGYWFWYAVYDTESGKLVTFDSNGYA